MLLKLKAAVNVNIVMKVLAIVLFLFLFQVNISAQDYNYNETGLPVCYITTDAGVSIDSKEIYLPAVIKIVQGNKVILSDSEIDIRVRGNATSTYPKKPYKLKFSRKTSPLPGMSNDKSFVLLANYTDRSLMNTAIGFKIGSMLEYGWVPKSEFVEVVINGEYLGNYQLSEDVKRGKSRVDIADSGFLIEFDFDYKSSLYYFASDYNNWFFTFKYPDDDEMLEKNFNDAKKCMDEFEAALYSSDFMDTRLYTSLIDEESFAKWYYHKNLLQMDECNRYYLKYDDTKDSKLEMGPLWDFEWCLGNAGSRLSPEHYLENKLYFSQLCKDEEFMRTVALVHSRYGDKIYSEILSYYDILADSLKKSQCENFKRWDILDLPIALSTSPLGSWEKEVEYSRNFFINHYEWIDRVLAKYLHDSDVVEIESGKPSASCDIYNIMGQKLYSLPCVDGIYILDGKKYTLSTLLRYLCDDCLR